MILCQFWGVKHVEFSQMFKTFRENSMFSTYTASRAVLGPTWPNLGRFQHPKWHPKATQKRSKTQYRRNNRKWHRNKAFEFGWNCQAPYMAWQFQPNSNAKVVQVTNSVFGDLGRKLKVDCECRLPAHEIHVRRQTQNTEKRVHRMVFVLILAKQAQTCPQHLKSIQTTRPQGVSLLSQVDSNSNDSLLSRFRDVSFSPLLSSSWIYFNLLDCF